MNEMKSHWRDSEPRNDTTNFHLNSITLAACLRTDYEEDLLGGYCNNPADRRVTRPGW